MARMVSRIWMISAAAMAVSGAPAMAQVNPPPLPPITSPSQNQAGPGLDNQNPHEVRLREDQDTAMRSMRDRAFVRGAKEGDRAEVRLGELAQQKSNSEDVKRFGRAMVRDHIQLSNRMKPIAQRMDVKTSNGLSKKDSQEVSKLEKLSGPQFDEAYIKLMLKDHRRALAEFRREADHAQNPQLKEAAHNAAEVIHQHLLMMEKIAKDHGVKR